MAGKMTQAAGVFKEGAEAVGTVLNGIVTFTNNILGNIGKVLSTGIIIFSAFIVWKAFWGQVESARTASAQEISHMTAEQAVVYFNERRTAYRDAITSISAPLATLAGVIPVIMAMGLMFKKWSETKNGNGGSETTTPPAEVQTVQTPVVPEQAPVSDVSQAVQDSIKDIKY